MSIGRIAAIIVCVVTITVGLVGAPIPLWALVAALAAAVAVG